MGVRIWGWRRQKGPTHEDIGAECEAFLQGSYVGYLASLDRAIPSWAWLNTLAHGTAPEIEALGRGTSASDWRVARGTEWYPVVAFLASETLLVARTSGHSITEIQNAVLADIELGLAQEASARSLRPEELVEHTLAALQVYRGDRRSLQHRRSQRRAGRPRR
jgi:hypothetical protein